MSFFAERAVSLNTAKENTKKARDGETAAKNALKVAQGGGAPS